MKKFLFVTVLFLSIVSLSQAQRGNGQRPSKSGEGHPPRFNPEQMLQRQLDGIDKAVSLTEAQKTKVKEVLQKTSEQRRAQFSSMRKSGEQPDREKMRTMMDELRKKETEAIKALLTQEQLPKYDTYLQETEKRMKERMKNRPGGGAPK